MPAKAIKKRMTKKQKIDSLQSEMEDLKEDIRNNSGCSNYHRDEHSGIYFCRGCYSCRYKKDRIEEIKEQLAKFDKMAKYGRVKFLIEAARRGGMPWGFHWGIIGAGPKGSVEVESACETLEEAKVEAEKECKSIGRKLPRSPTWNYTKPELSKRSYGTVLKGQATQAKKTSSGTKSKLSV